MTAKIERYCLPVGIFLAWLTAMVILGGIKRIANVSCILVPVLVMIYFGGVVIMLIKNFSQVGPGLKMIF